jgi:hypothetical protein
LTSSGVKIPDGYLKAPEPAKQVVS